MKRFGYYLLVAYIILTAVVMLDSGLWHAERYPNKSLMNHAGFMVFVGVFWVPTLAKVVYEYKGTP